MENPSDQTKHPRPQDCNSQVRCVVLDLALRACKACILGNPSGGWEREIEEASVADTIAREVSFEEPDELDSVLPGPQSCKFLAQPRRLRVGVAVTLPGRIACLERREGVALAAEEEGDVPVPVVRCLGPLELVELLFG